MELAAAAVALLAPYLAEAGKSIAGKAGEAAEAGIKAIHARVRRRLHDDPDDFGKKALARFEEEPADEGRQRTLTAVVAEKLQADEAFAAELRGLVEETTGGRPVESFLVQVYGGAVGKIVQIGRADSVSF